MIGSGVAACLAASLAASGPAGADVLAVQPGCSQREYVHLGTRMLAIADDLPAGVSVGFPPGAPAPGTTVDENAAAVVNVPFVLTTPGPLGCRVAFEYVVTPLTATPSQDYTPPPTPWRGSFEPTAANGATVLVPVTILPDGVYEADETFRLEITSVAGGVVGPTPVYVVTIRNDDPAPQITVDDVSQLEGSAATARFTLHLTGATGVAATVGYATADGEATAPGDYTAASGTVTFDAGQTTRTVDIAVVSDTTYEPDERFYLNLSGAVDATIGDAQASATLRNDDAPGLSVNEVRAVEGNAGLTGLQFTVSIEGPPPQTATAQWATANCTATPADYAPATGVVTFPAASSAPQTFTVWANGDTAPEGHELFTVGLSNPVNATLKDAAGHGSIENDDAPQPVASLPSADFNLDGNPDLLWFNTTSGNLVTWEMAGANRITGLFLDPPAIGALNWQVAGTPNLDADPQPDILWRNDTSGKLVVWLMDGVHRRTGLFLNPDGEADLNWRVVGTGEFATPVGGDVLGSDDILMRHELTGALRIWSMNGTKRDAVFDLPGIADLHWKGIGTGDFDGDGDADIWWRNDETGALRVWRMNGTTFVEAIVPTPGVLADLNWVSGGTPDIDRDGDPDLLWRNQVSGNLVVWLMDGTTRVCGVYLNPPAIVDGNWKLVGPR
jgi:hypothetical protein